ncbi:MAG: hypothetical protein L6R38_009384 [Xanthoria sp. 2 TBL-2021]|nr:MAG: hypothetical protein L6R38_009384 [Xanthoria sp. 2 TBL-2021]
MSSYAPQAGPAFFRFLDVPPEIRNIVYEYCLVIPGEIVPYPSDFERQSEMMTIKYETPTVALLQVNHQIRDEARVYLYGHNLWRLSCQSGPPLPTAVWDANLPFFRHITISFDHHDLTPESSRELESQLPGGNILQPETGIVDPEKVVRRLHLHACALKTICETKLDMIWRTLVYGNLITLKLNFNELMNPYTCNRSTIWDMVRNIESFQQMNRRTVVLPSDKVTNPARQTFRQRLTNDPTRVRRSRDPAVYIVFAGLREGEIGESLGQQPE